jgi:hypothetical protein
MHLPFFSQKGEPEQELVQEGINNSLSEHHNNVATLYPLCMFMYEYEYKEAEAGSWDEDE